MAASSWNVRSLRPPKRVLCAYAALELIDLGNLNKVGIILDSMQFRLKGDKCLQTEMAIFDRLHYKMRHVLKADKQMHGVRKVRNCLNRFCRMRVVNYCNVVKKDLDDFITKDGCSTHVYLPSRGMFLYVLIRLQGIARLFVQAVAYLQETFYYILQKVYLGHYLNANVLLLTTVSRLWILLRANVVLTCDWYRQLKPFVFKLKEAPDIANVRGIYEVQLSDDNVSATDFPDDLAEWLGADFETFIQEKVVEPAVISKALERLFGKVEPISGLLVHGESEKKREQRTSSLEDEDSDVDTSSSRLLSTEEDFGVSLTRDEFKTEMESKVIGLNTSQVDDVIERVKSATSKKKLKMFCSTSKLINDGRFTEKQRKKLHCFMEQILSGNIKCQMASARRRLAIFWRRPKALNKYSLDESGTMLRLSKDKKGAKKGKKNDMSTAKKNKFVNLQATKKKNASKSGNSKSLIRFGN